MTHCTSIWWQPGHSLSFLNCRYEDTKEELEEYQQSSQELEAEMEMQLDQAEKKMKEYKSQNERLQLELESLRVGTPNPVIGPSRSQAVQSSSDLSNCNPAVVVSLLGVKSIDNREWK